MVLVGLNWTEPTSLYLASILHMQIAEDKDLSTDEN